jgi:cytoskeleton-associated protein 5
LTVDDDPDSQLISIINHISSETTGALHKEGITELHRFLKTYPHKKPKVDKLLESTGPAFRKYLARALASRAAEDEDREAAVADTLSSTILSSESESVTNMNCRTGSRAKCILEFACANIPSTIERFDGSIGGESREALATPWYIPIPGK